MSVFDGTRAAAAYVRVRPDLVRYLTRLVGDADLAEDVAQEAYLRLQRRPPDDMEAVRPWLFRVATNVARDLKRSQRRHERLVAEHVDRLPTADPPADPADLAERADLRRRVRAALETLSPKERTALLLREEGFSHREIAVAVGTTTGTVGWLLARALTKAAARLDLEDEE